MNLTLSMIVYLLIGLVLGWGIYLVMFGKFWLLIVSSIIYLLLFAWYGCMESH